MKIVITGAHFTPAQAVVSKLQEFDNNIELVYIGRKYTREGDKSISAESQILPKLGVKFISLTTGRIQRKFTYYTIPSMLKIPWGFTRAIWILSREKPGVVLSFGGYVAVPAVLAAWLLSIPVIIHEQTLVSGLGSTITSYFASKIAVSFDIKYSFIRPVIVTGNPLRQELLKKAGLKTSAINEFIKRAKKNHQPIILITGGNQGSHLINQTIEQILPELLQEAFIIHQTGDSKYLDFENLQNQRRQFTNQDRYFVTKWIDVQELGELFRNISLAVSRAGVNTLLELAYFGVPTLVIPLPGAHLHEQEINANFFAKAGLGQVLLQKNLQAISLLTIITEMLRDNQDWSQKASLAKKVVISDAASRVALETIALISKPNV